jgi:hypothetical protein
MLEQTAARWLEATNFANLLYGQPSLVLYAYFDDRGNLHIRLCHSEEGTRQGCVFGSVFYAFGIAPLHERLAEKFSEFNLDALTDDLIGTAHPPMSDTEWQIFYRRYADYLSDLQSWGHAIGYTVHPDKLFLLLPPHAPTLHQGLSPP